MLTEREKEILCFPFKKDATRERNREFIFFLFFEFLTERYREKGRMVLFLFLVSSLGEIEGKRVFLLHKAKRRT